MPSMSETLIQELVATIVREDNPDAVIMFGSQARGEARPDSDVAKDLLLYSRAEFERFRDFTHHIIGRAHREGRVLYGRA